MSPGKRALDLALALVFLPGTLLLGAGVGAAILLRDGRPLFYRSERMRTPDRAFHLVKFRTMTNVGTDGGVTGADKTARITVTGRWLRRTRLDELPQLWNIFRGDMSFVGPRPPLREYVERFPQLYAEVLHCRPGITGLATLVYRRHENLLLAECETEAETDAVYTRRCIPRKARLDLIYRDNWSLGLDLWIFGRTAAELIRPRRAAAARARWRERRRGARS